MNNQILLKALVDKNLLDKNVADKLISESLLIGKSAEDIIYDRALIGDTELVKVKSEILKIPYKKVQIEEITKDLLGLISEETANTYKVIPLSKNKDMLVVGMINPDDSKAQEALRFVAKQLRINLGVFLITPSDFELVMRKYSPFRDQVEAAIRSLNIKPGKGLISGERIIQLEEGVAVDEEAPVIKIVASTLKEAVNLGASDIHIEPERAKMRIRFRVDGDLEEVSDMPIELHQPIVSRVKVMANLKIDENRVPQDGRFRSIVFNRDIDFRISTFPTPAGEKIAIRVLDPTTGLKSLDDLGLIGRNLEIVKEGIMKPYGMVLLTGPTGSGKTTTLYALLQILNKVNVNIVSLEDPVEYFIDGVNQSQVRPEIGYDFAFGLRQILRQDPDVIMVGEIRDTETASLAVHSALTGHIVLSTLHTNNAAGVIPRLIDMKVDSFLLPSSLNLMISQRLVSKVCQNCKKAEPLAGRVAEIVKKELDKLPAAAKSKLKIDGNISSYRGVGCKVCKNKGVVGRIAIFEVLQMTPEMQNIINAGEPTETKILEEAKRQGIITLRQDGILKALDGLVSIEEILKETE
ncbi:MAG: type IV pilus assembly protein PilB [Parcubacteria group bacterium Athens1014_26]|nr:MAG: type IV pilus assembly protein PilB [Parcubacteria group bacterium Athens1014_26]